MESYAPDSSFNLFEKEDISIEKLRYLLSNKVGYNSYKIPWSKVSIKRDEFNDLPWWVNYYY